MENIFYYFWISKCNVIDNDIFLPLQRDDHKLIIYNININKQKNYNYDHESINNNTNINEKKNINHNLSGKEKNMQKLQSMMTSAQGQGNQNCANTSIQVDMLEE